MKYTAVAENLLTQALDWKVWFLKWLEFREGNA